MNQNHTSAISWLVSPLSRSSDQKVLQGFTNFEIETLDEREMHRRLFGSEVRQFHLPLHVAVEHFIDLVLQAQ